MLPQVRELYQRRIADLNAIDLNHLNWNMFEEWHARARPIFIEHLPKYLDQFDSFLKVRFTVSFSEMRLRSQGIRLAPKSPTENDRIAANAKDKCSAFMESVLELSPTVYTGHLDSSNAETESKASECVFVVHGHDEEMKLSVARTLEKLGLKPIILHEQYDGGRVIIEKLEQHGNVGFAVVLLSPDDTGYKKADGAKAAKPRARQNVILELGYFVGRLGRDKVMALIRGNDLEVPGDFDGVVYTPFDEHEGWQKKLVRELKAAGYDVDANAL